MKRNLFLFQFLNDMIPLSLLSLSLFGSNDKTFARNETASRRLLLSKMRPVLLFFLVYKRDAKRRNKKDLKRQFFCLSLSVSLFH